MGGWEVGYITRVLTTRDLETCTPVQVRSCLIVAYGVYTNGFQVVLNKEADRTLSHSPTLFTT